MLNLLYAIVVGIGLGLSLAAPPGPMNALMARESTKSRWHGTAVGAGAMTADAVLLVITFFFSKVIPKFIINYFYLAGAIILLYMAYGTLKAKVKQSSMHANYFLGLGIGISNPFQIAWWLTAGLFLITNISIGSIVGLFIGILIWIFSFPYLIHKTKRYYEAKWVNYVSCCAARFCGAYALYRPYKPHGNLSAGSQNRL